MARSKLTDIPGHCPAVRTSLDLEKIAAGLYLNTSEAREVFANTRFTTWLSLLWARRVLPVPPTSKDVLRTFNKSVIRFQTSKHMGTKRPCNLQELILDTRGVGRYIIVDARWFPELTFYPIGGIEVSRCVVNGKLGVNGISPADFDIWLRSNFRLELQEVSWE